MEDHPAVLAMSYDPVSVLRDFAEEHGITYPLLSDKGSRVIRELGLENLQVEEQNRHFGLKTDERHQGLPYPGTFRLDAAGIVVERWFEQSHRVRPSGAVLLEDALGDTPPAVSDRGESAGVAVEAALGVDIYHPKQIYRLRVRLGVPEGQHIYVGEVPGGFTGLSVELSGPPSLTPGTPEIPSGESFEVEGIDTTFEVTDGLVETAVPFRIDEDEGDVAIRVTVQYQTCTDRECYPPARLSLTLPLRAGGVLRRR